MLLLWLLIELSRISELFECMSSDGVLVLGNTFRFGFTTYELQCYPAQPFE